MATKVELPNGVVLEDVPDDATDEEIRTEAIRIGAAKDADFRSLGEEVVRDASIVSRGATPVVAGALAGGALGIPGGPPGILAGSLLGSMSLPLADAGTDLWNYATPDSWDLETKPSAYINQLLNKFTPEPETTFERGLEVAGAGLGGALTSVPAAITAKGTSVIADILAQSPKQQVIASAPSAGAGQIVAETTGSPIAGMAASVLTGNVGGRTPANKQQSTASIKKDAGYQYKLADESGVAVNPEKYREAMDDIYDTLRGEGMDTELPMHQNISAFSRNQRMRPEAGMPDEAMSLAKLERLRRTLGGVISGGGDEGRLALIARNKLDDFVDGLDESSLVSGKAGSRDAIESLSDARNLWRKGIKAEMIDEIFFKAENAAGANYTSAGLETSLRQKFRSLADNPRKFKQFNAEEQEIILQIVRGGNLQNSLRLIGKLAPTGSISAAISIGGGHALGGPSGAALLPAVGASARHGAGVMGLKNFEMLDELIRNGRVNTPRSIMIPRSIRGLMSSQYADADEFITDEGISLMGQ